MVAVIGILVALLLPAIQAARKRLGGLKPMNNMKQRSWQCITIRCDEGHFRAHAICDANGKPLLSCASQILPYLEQQALYNEFHLDEPWDSDHNKPLIARMPVVLRRS